MRLWLMEGSSSVCSGESRRKPLQLLTGFFGRKSRREDPGREQGSRETGGWLSHDGGDEEDSDGDLLHIPEPMEALHSPYHARTIHEDMENLRLSRQDNPFLLELEVSCNLNWQFLINTFTKLVIPNIQGVGKPRKSLRKQ